MAAVAADMEAVAALEEVTHGNQAAEADLEEAVADSEVKTTII